MNKLTQIHKSCNNNLNKASKVLTRIHLQNKLKQIAYTTQSQQFTASHSQSLQTHFKTKLNTGRTL